MTLLARRSLIPEIQGAYSTPATSSRSCASWGERKSAGHLKMEEIYGAEGGMKTTVILQRKYIAAAGSSVTKDKNGRVHVYRPGYWPAPHCVVYLKYLYATSRKTTVNEFSGVEIKTK